MKSMDLTAFKFRTDAPYHFSAEAPSEQTTQPEPTHPARAYLGMAISAFLTFAFIAFVIAPLFRVPG